MESGSDTRIPVSFGAAGATDAAWLVEDDAMIPASFYAVRFTLPPRKFGHATGCACCTLRGPAADALTRMFRDRSIAKAPFFRQVIVLASAAGQDAVREALEQDVVTKARYVLAE
jgi:hypothetical protein